MIKLARYFLLGITLSFTFSTAIADTSNSHAQHLQQLKQQIHSLSSQVSLDKNQLQQNVNALRQSETQSATIYTDLKNIDQTLQQQQQKLKQLQRQEQKYQLQLAQQQQQLAQQLKSAYVLTRQPYLKLLFNQQKPEEISRVLTYYAYLSKQRVELIDNIKNTLNNIKNSQEQIKQTTLHLTQLKINKQQQQQSLQQESSKRHSAIKNLNHLIQNKNQKIYSLSENKKNLEQQIATLNATTPYQGHINFSQLQGHLIWPVHGKVNDLFGRAIDNSQIHWNSVLIDAAAGTPVTAIADGKIIFANWMPQYGLLLIIDHGNGYMSLYGRNQTIAVKTGDVVRRGEEIATVGSTGGYATPALYFAIRHNGTALDPVKWCK